MSSNCSFAPNGPLSAYPPAFEITDKLRGEFVFSPDLEERFISEILEELLEWNRSKAGFILFSDTIRAFYAIRGSLGMKPISGNYTEEQKRTIWEAKNNFRKALRADLNLLYVEENIPNENQST